MTRPTWPIGTEVILLWDSYQKEKPTVYKYLGFPPRAKTKALFSTEVDECASCGSKNVTRTARYHVESFIPADDPDIPALRDAWKVRMALYEESNNERQALFVKYGCPKWNDPKYQKYQEECVSSAAQVLAAAANIKFAEMTKEMSIKHHGK